MYFIKCMVAFSLLFGLALAQEPTPQAKAVSPPVQEQITPPAENPMGSFMGAKWGETMPYFKEHFKNKEHLRGLQAGGYYIDKYSLGDVQISMIIFIFQVPGSGELRVIQDNEKAIAQLIGAGFNFSPDQYEALLKIFTEKYGKPTKEDTDEIQNRMGAKFAQQEAEWIDGSIKRIISLKKYAEKIDEGRAIFLPLENIVDPNKEKEKAKKAAEGL